MIENIKIKVMGEEREVSKNTTFFELSKMYQNKFSFPIIVAKQDNNYKELSLKITNSGDITFYDFNDREGNRIYLNGLVYLTIYAFNDLFGGKIRVKYSIDKGLYIETDIKIDENKIEHLKKHMHVLIDMDLPIDRINVDRLDAIKYFESVGDDSKVGLMKYNTNTYVTLYKLGKMYNFFFSQMPISTKVLDNFDIKYINENGFVLLYPNVYLNGTIKEYVHHEKMFDVQLVVGILGILLGWMKHYKVIGF